VKIGIVSDVHGNIAGLDRALALMGDVDELICAGDSIYQFRFGNEAVNRLRERGAHTIQGNHEETFFSRDGERARAAGWIDRDAMAWLAQRPLRLELERDGRRILVVHGSPWEPRYEYIYPHTPALQRFSSLDAEVVILGHTHHKMAVQVGPVLAINPGSAGDARDARNGRQLSCAVLDTRDLTVQFFDFPDPAREIAAQRSAALLTVSDAAALAD
jgi:putative phosphoesterase